MSTIDSKRLRLLETDNLSIDLEYNEQFAILHIPRAGKFRKGELQTLQSYLKQWDEFIYDMGLDGPYTVADTPITEKLVNKLGFVYLGNHGTTKVYKYGNPSGN